MRRLVKGSNIRFILDEEDMVSLHCGVGVGGCDS